MFKLSEVKYELGLPSLNYLQLVSALIRHNYNIIITGVV